MPGGPDGAVVAKAEEKAPGVLEVSWDKDAPGEYEYNDYLQMVVYCDWGKQEWGFRGG